MSRVKQKYELTAWDRFKYPAMFLGGTLILVVSVGVLFFGLADLLTNLFR